MGEFSKKANVKRMRFLMHMGVAAVILFAIVGTKSLTNFIMDFKSEIDYSNPSNDEWLYPKNHYQFDSLSKWQPPSGYIKDFYFQNDVFFVLTSSSEVFILNYSNPQNPKVISKITLNAETNKIFVSEDYLFTASSQSGIVIYDISQIRNPKERYHYKTENNYIRSFTIKENLAYLAKGIHGLEILDLSDISDPKSLLKLNFEKDVQDIFIRESLLFLAVEGIIGPTNQSTTSFLNPTNDITIRREIYGNGLIILDIKNINSPKLVSYYFERCNYLTSYLRLSVDSEFVHLVDGKSGFKIIDIKDIYNPIMIGGFVEDEYYLDLAARTNFTFVSTYEQGLQVFDTTNKTQPIKVAQYFVRSPTLALYLGEDFASIANQNDGLITINFDRDMDSIDDLAEISEFNTDPHTQDTDADELSDHEEIFVYGTDPILKDTDRDRFNDFYEIQRNHDPLNPDDHPIYFSLIALFTLGGVLIFLLLSFRFAVVIERQTEHRRMLLQRKLAIKKNSEIRLLKLLYLLDSNKSYSFRVLAGVLSLKVAEIKQIIRILHLKGCIERVGECDFKRHRFTKKELKIDYKKKRKCYYCKSKLHEHQVFCKKCNNVKFFCLDCHQIISYNEPIGICPICMANFHLEHILTEVQQNECCPICFYEVYLNEIAVIIPYKK
ncbi:MAG: hypothetical protein ACTSPC_01730 [Candidatus Heimdallarchaeota archaeon]